MYDIYSLVSRQTMVHVVRKIQSEHAIPLMLEVSGSHLYGTNAPDSDLDIRGVYITPTIDLVSLRPPRDTIEGLFQGQDGEPKIDYHLYEIGKLFRMLLANNGSAVELLLAPTVFHTHEKHEHIWKPLGVRFLSRQLLRYYRGCAHTMEREALVNGDRKSAIHAYRNYMTGTVLMRTDVLHFTLDELSAKYGNSHLDDVLALERGALIPDTLREVLANEFMQMERDLREATLAARLPINPDVPGLDALLRHYRLMYVNNSQDEIRGASDLAFLKPKPKKEEAIGTSVSPA